MDARLRRRIRVLNGCDHRQRFVFDSDQIQSFGCNILIDCGNGGHRIADHPDFSDCQWMFILADRKRAVGNRRQIRSRKDRVNAGVSFCFRNINMDDAGVRNRTSQKLCMQHARKKKVVRIFQLADAFCLGIDLDERLPYDPQAPLASVIPSHKSSPWRVRLFHRPSARPPWPAGSPRASRSPQPVPCGFPFRARVFSNQWWA